MCGRCQGEIIACAAGGRGDPCTQCESEKRKVARGALICSQGRGLDGVRTGLLLWKNRDMLIDARKYCVEATMLDGGAIRIRAIRADDKERLHAHFRGLSEKSVY